MTDTDLITTQDRSPQTLTGQTESSSAVKSDSPTAASAPDVGGSLSTMVLPELRALANSVGVKGTSGMRKGDLISAIRETRGGGGSQRGSADESSTPTTTANA